MLRGNNLVGFGSGGAGGVPGTPETNFEVTSTFYSSSTLASFTDSSAAIGTSDDSRVIYVVAMFARGSSGACTCTVGGTSLSVIVSDINNGSNDHSVIMFAGVIDASHGDTADVVINPSGSAQAMGFVTCASYNNTNGATATDTAQSTSNTISGLVVDAGGIGICAFYTHKNVTSVSFTNATEIFLYGDPISSGGAVGQILGAQSATITGTLSPTDSNKYSISAAFR